MEPEEKPNWLAIITAARAGMHQNSVEYQKTQKVIESLEYLSAGETMEEIKRRTGLSLAVIRNLKWKYMPAIAEAQKPMAVAAGKNADLYLGLLERRGKFLEDDDDALKKISPRELALTAAIQADKMVQLSGGATAVVEHRSSLSLEDAKRMIEEAKAEVAEKRRGRVVDAEEVGSGASE